MDGKVRARTRITGSFNHAILSLTLTLLLTACGGGGAPGSNSTTIGTGSAVLPTSATLAWNAPTGAINLAGYRLYIGTAPGTYSQPYGQGVTVGNVTTYTLMGLSSGTRYYFAVTALDTSGNESVYSNEAYKDVP